MAYRSQIDFLQEAKANGLNRDEAMQALSAYRAEGGAFSDSASVQPQAMTQDESGRPGFGSRLLNTIGTGLEYVDRYTGSPVRTAIATAQNELADNGAMPSWKDARALGRGLSAGLSQFGRPTSEGASGRDIAENMGATGLGAGALGLAYDIALDPTNLIPGKAISKPLQAITKSAPVTRATQAVVRGAEKVSDVVGGVSKGAMARASGMTREALETAATDPQLLSQARTMAKNVPGAESAISGQLNAGLRKVSDDALQGVERAVGTPRADLAYQSGNRLLETSKEASKAIGSRFDETAGEIMRESADRGINYSGRVNVAAQRLSKIATEAGIDMKGGTSGVPLASKFGGKSVLDKEADILQRTASEAVGLENVGELLDLRRGLDARIYAAKSTPEGAGLFTSATGGSKAADAMRESINRTIGEHIALKAKETAPKGRGDAMAAFVRSAWDDALEIYSKSRRGLESVEDAIKANTGNAVEKMVSGIQSLSVDELKSLKSLAKSDPAIAPVFKQIGDSFVDGLVIQSSKSGAMDVGELRKAWGALGTNKDLLFDKRRISQIEGAIKQFEDVSKSTDMLGRPGVLSQARAQVSGVGSLRKSQGTSASAKVIEDQLSALDQMLGHVGDESLLRQAKALNLAKGIESGVTRLQTGLALGGAAAGYSAGSEYGGVAGGILGALTGAAATSPAGAIAAYRLMNKSKVVGAKMGEYASRATGMAGRGTLKMLEMPRRYRSGVVELGRQANQEDDR